MTTVVWFRHDLRLEDHPALTAAAEDDAVGPVFIWAPDEEDSWPPGGAHRWWLREALADFDDDLRRRGLRLILRRGVTVDELSAVCRHTGADRVVWQKRYEPAMRQRDLAVAEALREEGVATESFEGRLLYDSTQIQTDSGGPYHVYTPFKNKFRKQVEVPPPLDAPRLGASRASARWPASVELDALELSPEAQDGVDWAEDMRRFWTPGEQAGQRRLRHFLDEALGDHKEHCNVPGVDGSSRLSPYLHHGHLSPRQVWHAVEDRVQNGVLRTAADAFLDEILWREFSYHLLYHYPRMPEEPLREVSVARGRRGAGTVAARPDGLSHRGRWHVAAMGARLDA